MEAQNTKFVNRTKMVVPIPKVYKNYQPNEQYIQYQPNHPQPSRQFHNNNPLAKQNINRYFDYQDQQPEPMVVDRSGRSRMTQNNGFNQNFRRDSKPFQNRAPAAKLMTNTVIHNNDIDEYIKEADENIVENKVNFCSAMIQKPIT